MKKILIVAATAGLMSLAACQPTANNTVVETNTVEANTAIYDNVTETTTVDNATPADMNSTTTTTTNTTGNTM
jgi:ABC-type oligopeptide transport system substrate-binding subunit